MNREQLAHILRAAARITDDPDILVLGSQSILGTRDADQLPEATTLSIEADIAFRNDPDEAKADKVEGVIGLESSFHHEFGFYGQGVSVSTAVLPEGWEHRLVPFGREDADPSAAMCLDCHDLVIAKLVAGREKDVEFATELIAADLVDPRILLDRANALPEPEGRRGRVRARIEQCAKNAGYG